MVLESELSTVPPSRPPGGARAYLKLARPKQWSKNVLVFAAPGAAGVLSQASSLGKTLLAFVAFSAAASGTYAWNDSLDVRADRQHPTKCKRPVASGAISVRNAQTFGTVLLVVAIAISFLASWKLAAVIAGYVAITTAYSLWLKHEAVLDLAAVAAGFVLRAVAGGAAVDVPISTWFLIVAASGSLFMVTGKRHAEQLELGADASGHRRTLAGYSTGFLLYVRAVSSAVAILAYCLWAFENSNQTGNAAWFELSIIPFVLAVFRYALLLEQGEGGAPEDLVLSDRTLLVLGALWAVVFGVAVYLS
jgi:decaprenyl-phosphate phosphoribosyltransferase